MRKIFFFLAFFSILMLCGCNKISSKVTAVTTELNFTAKIDYNDEEYEFKVDIPDISNIRMETVTPKRLKGTVFEFSDSAVTLEYCGIKYPLALSDLPEDSVIGFIHKVFSDADKKKNSVELKNNEFYITGNTDPFKYKLYFGTTGLPIKITDEKNGLSVIIKNATIKKAD